MDDHLFRYRPHGMYDAKVDQTRCVASVSEPGRGIHIYQCNRKRQPGTEWCKQHSVEACEKRRQKGHDRYEESKKREPWYIAIKYREALERIQVVAHPDCPCDSIASAALEKNK